MAHRRSGRRCPLEQVRVALQATDPLSLAGLTNYLQSSAAVTLVRGEGRVDADVVVMATECLTCDVVSALRRTAIEVGTPVVLVVAEISEAVVSTLVECRVVGVVQRATVTGERLLQTVLAVASGGGVLPPNLLGELLQHVERLQRDVLAPHGLNAWGLTRRETDVLRMMADGLDTAEIAEELRYSERTVKNVIYGVMRRLKLRSRAHAVAYALRAGMI